MIRALLITVLTLGVAAAIALTLVWREYRAFETMPLLERGEARIWLPAGATLASLARELERLGMTRADWRWRVLGRMRQPVLLSGEYRVGAGSSPIGLLDRMQRGEVVAHRLTIVEGWTVARLRSELASDSRLVQVARDLDESELMRRLGCEGCYAEGWFLPETYQFQRGDRDLDVLARAHRAMRETLYQTWTGRLDGLPLETPEDLLVLASLVEAETRVASERETVAGVFVRRLQRGMRLQTDPTVVYGIRGPFDGRIRRVHLRTDHPWNTYTRHGLPPTPIALPGAASLRAAARPADGDALYFVARGDGSHHFSATLDEHNRAVRRYILGRP